jgi:hypothetical protein
MSIPASMPLQNLRVLDMSRVRAGPTCCRIIADFGANVIKIEALPGVDPTEGMSGSGDGYGMLNLHRDKRSLALNLNDSAGRERDHLEDDVAAVDHDLSAELDELLPQTSCRGRMLRSKSFPNI